MPLVLDWEAVNSYNILNHTGLTGDAALDAYIKYYGIYKPDVVDVLPEVPKVFDYNTNTLVPIDPVSGEAPGNVALHPVQPAPLPNFDILEPSKMSENNSQGGNLLCLLLLMSLKD